MADLFQAMLIETTNTCNRKCLFCKFGQPRIENEKANLMPWEIIKKIVSNLEDLEYKSVISWRRINEPMMDKRIYEIIDFTKKRLPDCWQSLLSNGDMLDQTKIDRLHESGLDVLGISVYDDESMEKVKNFHQVALLDRRHPVENWIVNKGDSIDFSKFNNPKLIELGTKRKKHAINLNCPRPSNTINVMSNGDVVICCMDLHSDVIMGNINTQKLEEIWNCKKFNHYRDALKREGRANLDLCKNCDAVWPEGKPMNLKWPAKYGPNWLY